MISLALAYLRDRPLTTALNVLLLAISVAMLVLLLQFGSQAGDKLDRDAREVDLVVGAKGSPLQLILSSVFHVDRPTGNIPLSSLDLLRRDPAVARAVPLALGDNFFGFRIVGTDETFAELYGAKIAQGRDFDQPMEAVFGSQVASETGAQPGQRFVGSHGLSDDASDGHVHAESPFEVVGILEPTGTVADRLILTRYESVWDVHGIGHDHDHGDDDHSYNAAADEGSPTGELAQLQSSPDEPEKELTALLVTYHNAAGAVRLPAMINRQTNLQSAVPASETARLLELMGASLNGIRIFGWLLAATGGLAIFVALLNMARSRAGDLALLRVMGASRVQVFATVVLEGVLTAAMGAALGWIGAHVLITLARASSQTLSDLGLQPWQPVSAEVGLLLIVVAIGALAALIPALQVYRIDPARVLARS